jgi:hypothetical protein
VLTKRSRRPCTVYGYGGLQLLARRAAAPQVDRSVRFQYVDVGTGRRCYRVLAYNSAGNGPLSAVTCAAPPGG